MVTRMGHGEAHLHIIGHDQFEQLSLNLKSTHTVYRSSQIGTPKYNLLYVFLQCHHISLSHTVMLNLMNISNKHILTGL